MSRALVHICSCVFHVDKPQMESPTCLSCWNRVLYR